MQIIHIKTPAPPPAEGHYVLVEPMPEREVKCPRFGYRFPPLAFFNPSPFSSLDEAIASSKSWAEEIQGRCDLRVGMDVKCSVKPPTNDPDLHRYACTRAETPFRSDHGRDHHAVVTFGAPSSWA